MTEEALTADSPVTALKGVGDAVAERLHQLDIKTLHDLVWTMPRIYKDRSDVTDIIDVVDGADVTIHGEVEKIAGRHAYRKRRLSITEAMIGDDTGSIKVTWFNQPYIAESLHAGDDILLSGKAKKTKYGLSLQSPVYEKVPRSGELTHTGRIVPEYTLTRGVTQKQMRYFVKQALGHVLPVAETLPRRVLHEYDLLPLTDALQQIHFPESEEAFEAAQRRHDFDRLLLVQLHSQMIREELEKQPATALEFYEEDVKAFVADLPFTLTDAQRKVTWQILQDTALDHPMNRLVVGDVGSGKTVVAAIAMLNAVKNGGQAALMAPTEILAKQHAAGLRELLEPHGIQVGLLTGSTSKKRAEQAQLPTIEDDIIIGTHALIQKSVSFERLGLVVVDEQHRFGVNQRRELKERSGDVRTMPHLLSMTATPIPRTLALTMYGDLQLSIIDEMPPGRKDVKTSVIPAKKRRGAYDFIGEHVATGEQCFVICPLIEPSTLIEARSVTQVHEQLSREIFPTLRVEMLHGKMKPAEKDEIMTRMRAKEIDILVSTSVIEVGVDIPDATIMMIEDADRFGLAQLHQFRGRVGRSDVQSYCFLFSSSNSERARDRLAAMTTMNDGFKLAEFDLEMRGPGQMYGTSQTGFDEAISLAYQHPDLLELTQKAAAFIIEQQMISTHEPLRKQLNEFITAVHLE